MNENNEKINLANYTEEELSKLSPDQIQKLFFETLKEIVEVSQNITKGIDELDKRRKKAEQSGDSDKASVIGQAADNVKMAFAGKVSACNEIIEGIKEDAKTLSIFNQSNIDREKSFVEIISEPARVQQESIQKRRDEMYEEMIKEAVEVESPMNRSHR